MRYSKQQRWRLVQAPIPVLTHHQTRKLQVTVFYINVKRSRGLLWVRPCKQRSKPRFFGGGVRGAQPPFFCAQRRNFVHFGGHLASLGFVTEVDPNVYYRPIFGTRSLPLWSLVIVLLPGCVGLTSVDDYRTRRSKFGPVDHMTSWAKKSKNGALI